MRTPDRAVSTSNEKGPQYLIPEHVYEYNHSDIIYYTNYFFERAERVDVFGKINTVLNKNRNLDVAEKMAGLWFEFSKFVPSFIAKAVSLTVEPEHQHYLIQIAYDELGAQDKNHIHSKLFLAALEMADIKLRETTPLFSTSRQLFSLQETLEQIKTTSDIIGLLLSIEIIAENNIETVFRALSVDDVREEILSSSMFFKLHRTNEVEHVRHSVANFLRFSRSQQEIKDAEKFFDIGIIFWKNFWDKIAELIVTE